MINITMIAGGVVALAGLWLISVAALSVLAPQSATRLLSGFASSARVHFLEQALRIAAGTGFIFFASEMRYTGAFRAFGWILIVTSVILTITPWRWHQRFAGLVVPIVNRNIRLFGFITMLLAGLIFYSLL